MPRYKIWFGYQGDGMLELHAENEAEARAIFATGEWEQDGVLDLDTNTETQLLDIEAACPDEDPVRIKK